MVDALFAIDLSVKEGGVLIDSLGGWLAVCQRPWPERQRIKITNQHLLLLRTRLQALKLLCRLPVD